ncbi:hypothetical protein [Micromonospora sp. WMMD1155]|uniref:hypothetical protein n=1 Tax=Micromonospora sp. WMMD1155 TaxID=3016094 RepID=UPI00249B1CF5|nr:hypothetical protein [Micromonospora sp. WMMD1155]WFE53034.1 hypothetical protein O7617_23135 [Micromonospora sp. WMMD1155]
MDDLDCIVLGLAYEHRRRVSDREFLTLDEEPAMIARIVARVYVGPDWSRPTVEWTPVGSRLPVVNEVALTQPTQGRVS